MRFVWFLLSVITAAAQTPPAVQTVLTRQCSGCHNARVKQGGLDLSALRFTPADAGNFARWGKIHDRVRDGEMPPMKVASFTAEARGAFLKALAAPLAAADRARYTSSGRAVWRRMNRYEYENSLRDLLDAPWLQIKELLPEDGEAYRFNKSGEALDVSHVQMSQYLAAAEYALREALPKSDAKPVPETKRYYAREQRSFANLVQWPRPNERNTFPVIGFEADVPVLHKEVKPGAVTGPDREIAGMGVIASAYEPIEPRFVQFTAPVAGRYKVRLAAHTAWVGPEKGARWWKPDFENVSKGRTHEPVTLYAETPPRQMRRLGGFDVHPDPSVNEIEVWLLKKESIRPDAARFFRSRPPGNWQNPLATPEGQPGVVFRWLEVEGPLVDAWPGRGQQLLFGDLPFAMKNGAAEFRSERPNEDARGLIANFLRRAYRRPVASGEADRFAKVADKALAAGYSFTEAMIAAYSAVLCSPGFVTMEERPGKLDSYAVASRLSYFMWNSEPDAALRDAAARGGLQTAAAVRGQAQRLLKDSRSQRFVEAFLDYWLDLRKINNTSPDSTLYPDYYLDDLLVESAGDETRAFFNELLRGDLPARLLISSDFAMLNERLAAHYGVPGVTGTAFRKVKLPEGSPRGGLLTQASVLKVTANGTTTSPVLRGVWMTERILGRPVPPPPPGVPAVEPDTRGATTIREQLAKHRSQTACSGCHARIDPPGFALESFDVAGGWRDRYRALGEGEHAPGIGKGGHLFEFHYALPADPSSTLPDGRAFADVRELKKLLLADERQIARNLLSQLVVYATGAPVRFGDRAAVESMLDRAKPHEYGVASLIEALVESDLFRSK